LEYTIISKSATTPNLSLNETRYSRLDDRLIYSLLTNARDHSQTRIDYTYNDARLLTKVKKVVDFDSLALTGLSVQTLLDLYEYDNLGNCTLFEQYNVDGEVWRKIIRKYSDEGLLLEEVNIQDSGPRNTMIDRKKTYSYDNLNNMTLLEHQYEALGKIEIRFISYEYDGYGNWVG
jgi:hypothetical protein